MNRQARLSYWAEDKWIDFGSVTFEQAAKMLAKDTDNYLSNIYVRDQAEPEKIHNFLVKRKVEFQVLGLRGGE